MTSRQHEREHVGEPATHVISPDDLAALEETLATLIDEHAMRDIAEADAAYARGDVVRGTDAIRALRP